MTRKKTGRPPLDRELILDRLEPYLVDGVSFELACPAAGCGPATVRDWIRTDGRIREMVEAWRSEGRAVKHDRCIDAIMKAATGREDWTTWSDDDGAEYRGDWRAAAWYLERTRPDLYGRVGCYAVKTRTKTVQSIRIGEAERKEADRELFRIVTGCAAAN